MTNFIKGHIPWNKGKKKVYSEETLKSMREAKLRNPVKYWLGKERTTKYWLGKKRPDIQGINNYAWKGDRVSYSALHHWVKRYLGKPNKCEYCGSSYFIDWANKSHEYKRELSDWLSLCRKCHKKYDKK